MRKLENGMMTVEASFLLPIIFFIFVLILFFFLYCYEDGVAAGILREEVEKAGDVIKTNGNINTGEYNIHLLNQRKLSYLLNYDSGQIESQCKSNIRKKLSEQSLFGSDQRITVEIKHGEIRGKITSNIKLPIIGSVEIGGFSLFHVDQQVIETIRMPAEQIRRWQQIE
ncbi:MAG: hypothetical protein Q4E73_11945 [Lachnospiraceae bacterium]|nr:hypothetical protein [Lachnospiraceae bacterium]